MSIVKMLVMVGMMCLVFLTIWAALGMHRRSDSYRAVQDNVRITCALNRENVAVLKICIDGGWDK